MKRCTACRGRGTEPIKLGEPEYLEAIVNNRKKVDGHYLKPCTNCNGRGFINPRFK